MLPKQHRLRHRSDVQSVRRRGRRFSHPLVIFLLAPSSLNGRALSEDGEKSGLPLSRFAFVASRRVGSAVKRNRAKRVMREALRLQMDNIQPGWDGIFIARQEAASFSLPETIKAVEDLLSRANILQSNQNHE